ncbi:MAG: threonylcarbamoyl-AMP synthase [Clostridia bacterium]|nr:threonylcarbamoyl-AMP synthase [Clostridia bacterium]
MNTKIFEIYDLDEKSRAELDIAGDAVKDGKLVIFPTETVYGLGADATNPTAVKNIYVAKGRPSDNPLIIHISEPHEAERYAYTSTLYYMLAEKFMPGPLTVILNAKDTVPPITRGGLDTVAVRCPSSIVARELIKRAGVAVAAPSANLSGTPSPTSSEHVIKDMVGRVDVIIASAECEIGLESTIVKIESEDSVTLLRPGAITVDQLCEVENEVAIADAVTDNLGEGDRPLSPGMKYRHYAPKAELVLVDADREDFIKTVLSDTAEDVAVISYSEYIAEFLSADKKIDVYDFGSSDDEIVQARNLFSILRKTDEKSYTRIYAPLPKKDGMGLALYNRMIRAAAHKIIRLRR